MASPTKTRPFPLAMSESPRPSGPVVGSLVAIAAILCLSLASVPAVLIDPEAAVQGGLLLTAPFFAVIWLVVWLWVRFKERRSFAGLGFRGRAPLAIVRGAVIGVGTIAITVAIGVASGNLEFLDSPTGPAYWPALGWVVLGLVLFTVQGGAEELLARGYLVQAWYHRTGLTGAVIASTVFFVLLHGLNAGFGLLPVIGLVLVAVALVFWALAEGGLWGVIAFHAAWNWAQGSLFGISVSGNVVSESLFVVTETEDANPLISGGVYGLEGSVVGLAILLVLAVGAVLAFLRSKQTTRLG
ncbi:CPBP family intramembrane metalloprotease [Microbacterium sp. LRZ72]|uniref:CPBP family intramembrane glutamic endopeptidase n=1 Tax=Microbacterium sp. LRZ72 TaxID=2942481 RepID=UPI00299FC361|nr:type II CAAX endopeptidase family protein [Microbacterium sp. LRZ72]MDX2375323.1 CPBP family intramembrane metalloprotease [Microbacterium sp. LRZ72]